MCDRFYCPNCGGWMTLVDSYLGVYECDTCDTSYNIMSDTWEHTEVEDEGSVSN